MSDPTKEQVTNATDYKKKFGPKIELVTLPSGAIFKIRKLQVVDFLATVAMPLGWVTEEDLKTWEDKSVEERKDLIMKNKDKDPDGDINFAKTVLENGVVEPKVVRFGAKIENNEINIDEIDPIDIVVLSQEIATLSGFDSAFRDRVRPFRGE